LVKDRAFLATETPYEMTLALEAVLISDIKGHLPIYTALTARLLQMEQQLY
jgi:hypothetical protein